MKILTSLEGLTPAGLEHLMETQDRMAVKVSDNLTENAVHSENGEEPLTSLALKNNFMSDIGNGLRPSPMSGLSASTKSAAGYQPNKALSSYAARPAHMRFVDVSSNKSVSIPSPLPSVQFQSAKPETATRQSKLIANQQINISFKQHEIDQVKKKLQFEDVSNDSRSGQNMSRPRNQGLSTDFSKLNTSHASG